jgi:hypothetical protein
MRPFNWQRGTSLLRRRLPLARLVERCRSPSAWPRCRDRSFREQLRRGSTTRTPTAQKGSTLPPPPLQTVFVDVLRRPIRGGGQELAPARQGRARHAADVMCELAVRRRARDRSSSGNTESRYGPRRTPTRSATRT